MLEGQTWLDGHGGGMPGRIVRDLSRAVDGGEFPELRGWPSGESIFGGPGILELMCGLRRQSGKPLRFSMDDPSRNQLAIVQCGKQDQERPQRRNDFENAMHVEFPFRIWFHAGHDSKNREEVSSACRQPYRH
jgi:hypothetical protein